MSGTPDAFVWDDVIRFGKVLRPRIHRRDQVVNVYQHSVRCYVMTVAGVIVRCTTYETSGEWIDPGARTDAGLATV